MLPQGPVIRCRNMEVTGEKSQWSKWWKGATGGAGVGDIK